MGLRVVRGWWSLLLLLFSGGSAAASVVVVSDQARLSLQPYLSWYYDASGSATVGQVGRHSAHFQGPLDRSSLPRTQGAYWLRLRLQPKPGAEERRWLLELPYTQLDRVDLYVRSGSFPSWHHEVAGDLRPLSAQSLRYPQPLFQLPLKEAEELELLLRVQSSTTIAVPLRLWQQESFDAWHQKSTLVNGIVYGVLLGLVFYNLFLFPTVRDNAYLWFSLYLGAFLLFQFSMAGLVRLYLFPEWPAAADRALSLSLWFCMAAGLRFTQYISLSRRYAPRLNRLLSAMVLFALVMFVAVVLFGPGPFFVAMPLFGVVVALLIPFPLVAAWRAGYPPARFTLMAFLPILPGVVVIVARTYGLLEVSFWTEHLFSIGTAVAAVLLSFALADRITFLRNEKMAAQAQLIEAVHAAEADRKRFSAQLLNAQDSERKRIAEELHDGVGQNLSFLASTLNRLARQCDDPALQRAQQVSRDTVNEIRAISHQLHPYILDQLGLVTAIESIVERIGDQGDIQCELAVAGDLKLLDSETELHLYRIVQEAVNNVIKHSRASHLLISLGLEGDTVVLVISDDGVGLADVPVGSGLGMESMRHRVSLAGGRFVLKSNRPQGLKIVITLPLRGV